MTQQYTIKHYINSMEQHFVLCQDRSMVFIYHSITLKVQNIHAEQLNFSAASNMEMVGIYPAALKKREERFLEKRQRQHCSIF